MRLLQEIDDLQEAGKIYLEQQKEVKHQVEKEQKEDAHERSKVLTLECKPCEPLMEVCNCNLWTFAMLKEISQYSLFNIQYSDYQYMSFVNCGKQYDFLEGEKGDESADEVEGDMDKEKNNSDEEESQGDTVPKAKSM